MTLEELKELLKDPRFNRARSIFENSRLEVQVEATNLLALTWKVLRQEAPPPELPKNTDDLLRRALTREEGPGEARGRAAREDRRRRGLQDPDLGWDRGALGVSETAARRKRRLRERSRSPQLTARVPRKLWSWVWDRAHLKNGVTIAAWLRRLISQAKRTGCKHERGWRRPKT